MTEHEKIEREKELAALRAATFVEDGMLVGLGTGSTVAYLIPALGQRVKDGLKINSVVTSGVTEALARQHGISVIQFDGCLVDLTIDGADEIDPQLQLIKGGGGALLHEKLVAVSSKRNLVIADSSKVVASLGERAALPVEVVKFGWQRLLEPLTALGCEPVLRMVSSASEQRPFMTQEGNYIIDCRFGAVANAPALAAAIKSQVGVIEHGLFLQTAYLALIGKNDTVEEIAPQ